MIEEIMLNFLSGRLDVPVYMEEPISPTEKYVLIEKLGSSENNKLSAAVFAVQSYGKSLYEAAELNHRVKKAMVDMATLSEVISCRLNSDYNYTDDETGRYRYQAVFNITFYDN